MLKELQPELQIKQRELELQILSRSADSDYGTLTVGIVSDKVDTYNTWINPEGCDTPPQSVVIDFRHNGEPTSPNGNPNTGCELTNLRISQVDGVKTLIGDIKVPKTARLYIRGKNGQTVDDGSAYEAVKSGRIMGVSVEFDPRPYPEETMQDANGRIYYRKWRMLKLTLLDEPPSQDQAFILSKNNFRKANMDENQLNNNQEVTEVTKPENEQAAEQRADAKFKKHDVAKTKDGMVRVMGKTDNGYSCRMADGTEREYRDDDMSDASESDMRSYIPKLHERMAQMEDDAKKDNNKRGEMEDEAEEIKEDPKKEGKENEKDEAKETKNKRNADEPNLEVNKPEETTETPVTEPKEDVAALVRAAVSEAVAPLQAKIEELQKEETQKRSVKSTLVPVEQIRAAEETAATHLADESSKEKADPIQLAKEMSLKKAFKY